MTQILQELVDAGLWPPRQNRFSLATQFKRLRNPRRKTVTLRQIVAPATLASDLYASAYKPVIELWQAAIPELLAEYERSLAALTTDAPADLSARIGKVEADSTGLFVTIRARLERWASIVEVFQRKRWRAAVLSATGVDLGTLIGPGDARETLEATIERNVALVRSVSDEAQGRIADAVFRGLRERRSAADVGRDIREAVDMGTRRAKNIAADQTTKIAASLNSERRRQAGIDTWAWVASHKLHPRKWHHERDGNLYSENSDRIGTEYEGKIIRTPPPSDDLPSVPPYCGCTERAVLILD